MVFYAAIVALIAFAGPLAKRIPLVRAYLEPGERYAGQYVQIIGANENRRYSIIEIFYDAAARRYSLKGIQYDEVGRRAIDFDSETVAFHDEGPTDYFDFVWKAETVAEKERFDGFTRMNLDTKESSDICEGRGFFITFHNKPIRYDLRFFKITEQRLSVFRSTSPSTKFQLPSDESQRAEFVRNLHDVLATYPHLQPTEETGKPLL